MSNTRFNGVLAPVITPFQQDLSPSPRLLAAHCRWLISQGVALAIFGTNSEAASLSVDEKIMLLDHLLEAGIAPAHLMPGTGHCAITDCIRLTSHAVNLGCAGTLMLPPFYYKGVSDEGLYAYYAEVIERVASEDLRIYLYHIPPVSQIPISFALIERLVKHYPMIVAGIKDSSGDWETTRTLNAMQLPDFRVFCGSEAFLLQNMLSGGAGCISATANVNPSAIKYLYDNFTSPDAQRRQELLNKVRSIFQSFPMIPALKAATAYYSADSNWLRVRPPIMPLNDVQLQQLQQQLSAIGFHMSGLGEHRINRL